jgi:hypothetical protein
MLPGFGKWHIATFHYKGPDSTSGKYMEGNFGNNYEGDIAPYLIVMPYNHRLRIIRPMFRL